MLPYLYLCTKMSLFRWRANIRELAVALKDKGHRVCFADLVDIAEDMFPSNVGTYVFILWLQMQLSYIFYWCHWDSVPIGGALFDAYLQSFSSYRCERTYKHALKARPPSHRAIDMVINNDLMDQQMTKYCGYLIYHMNCVSDAAKLQVFYHTSFIAKFYGLSRRGINALSQYGYVCKLTYFDSQLAKMITKAQQSLM